MYFYSGQPIQFLSGVDSFDGRIHLGRIGEPPPDAAPAPQRPGADDTDDEAGEE